MTAKLIDRLLAPRRARGRSIFGVKVQSTWATAFLYDHLLTTHRDTVKWVTEIGTGRGGMSLILATWCRVNGVPFTTIEIGDFLAPEVRRTLQELGARVVQADVFTCQRTFTDLPGPGFLLCDGGDKPRELATFGPMVPAGSIVVTHDYGTETKDRDIRRVPEVEYYQPWHDESIAMRTTAAVLRRL